MNSFDALGPMLPPFQARSRKYVNTLLMALRSLFLECELLVFL